ncbi:MAG: hypothetical protein WB663_08405 [Beijerinckiaceae bacterium]
MPGLAFVAFAGLVWLTRQKRGAFALFVALAAVSAGFVSAGWKSARVAGPVLERIRVTTVTGFIEQMDYRRQGACFVMRLASAEGLSPEQMPRRIRLTDRYRPPAEAGAFVKLKARLLPPATRISPSSAPSAICGAITLKVQDDRFEMRTARAVGENRPWSRAPRAFGRASANTAQRGDTREKDLCVSDRLD